MLSLAHQNLINCLQKAKTKYNNEKTVYKKYPQQLTFSFTLYLNAAGNIQYQEYKRKEQKIL